ncbi:ParB family chromosome partitioning protein [Lachnospiraceae bacterium PM6-15]|uniref:ParB/RepB/Spo0J family partition protein n=1 Tax=Ohessyouella blattaphilus TaxID=2949333 RepID=A0ABT1EMS9_9FIRM|nr:ParB/RepB/Spo0J family partition protein [Ohessyouella blattaphilus]MCP1111102.1 ParB/RepB/Spo0J family partition protein [Ohessyouella blattaphilus]MCR8564496.1 ParB/RepB/Spo0J family partition protein [Ohessyouella blattaphilus]
MAVKRTGLGKGLDSLIPDNKPAAKAKKLEETPGQEYVMLNVNKIEPNRDQPRKYFNEDSIIELTESIKQNGVIFPIMVNRKDDYYQIVAGERRWRASKAAGLKEIPAVIKELSDLETLQYAIIENIQREDLNPIEEARAYKQLIEEHDLKQDEVAERLSKSRTTITNAMRLLKLDERVQQMIIDDMLTTGHARALLALDDGEQQYILANRIFDEKLSVRDIEKIVKELKNPKKVKEKKKEVNALVYQDLEVKMQEVLGTKVKVASKGKGKGKIEIEYYSEEELEHMFDMIVSLRRGE